MKSKRPRILCVMLAAIPLLTIQAQETLIEVAPSSLLKIEEAQKRNYKYFGDLLSLMPGLWVRELGSVGQWATCRIRGSVDGQSRLLLDGRPLEDPWSGLDDLNLIPVEMIDRIEIYPACNPFGLASAGGIVNIISKTLQSNRPYTKFVYRTGKNNFSDLDVTFGQKLTPKFEILSGVLLKKYGEELPNEHFKGQQFRSKITLRPLSGMEVRYSILQNTSDLDLPYGLPMPGDTLTLTTPHLKRNRYDHTLQTFWNMGILQNHFGVEHTSISYEIRDQDHHPKRLFPVESTSLFLKQNLRMGDVPLSWGIRAQRRQVSSADSVKNKDTVAHSFIQSSLKLPRDWNAVIGFHAHLSSDRKVRLRGSYNINWKAQSPLSLWAGYSEGLRDPSLGERFGLLFYPSIPETQNQRLLVSRVGRIQANIGLKPETSRTVEAGIRWKWKDKLQTSFCGYLRDSKNLIEGVFIEDSSRFANQNEARFRGVESQVQFGPYSGFSAVLVLNLMKATDALGGSLLERPSFWGNGALSWEHRFFQDDLRVHLCLGVRYWSEFWTLAGEIPDEGILQSQRPGLILDFKAFITIIQNASFTFAVDNILGTEVGWIAGFPVLQKAIRIGMAWELYE